MIKGMGEDEDGEGGGGQRKVYGWMEKLVHFMSRFPFIPTAPYILSMNNYYSS